MLLGLTAAAVKQVPEISRAIGHGVYHSSVGLQAATFGAAKNIAGGAASGAIRGVGAAASAWPGRSAVKRAATSPGAAKARSADRSAEEIVK